jgi:hypothetical protein
MSSLEYIDIDKIDQLFNAGGYVLDFSTPKFNSFTINSIGIPLCEEYGLSKVKSLWKFIENGEDHLVNKLLLDLLKYYENKYQSKLKSDPSLAKLFDECKTIANSMPVNNDAIQRQADSIREKFNTEYMDKQIDILTNSIDSNPTDAIGKAKELLESCCKTILDKKGVLIDKNWSVERLTKETCKNLKLSPDDIEDSAKASDVIRKVLGNLSGISIGLAELRNPYGGGHGKKADYKGLTSRHARLATGSAITVVHFLWETYLEQEGNDN